MYITFASPRGYTGSTYMVSQTMYLDTMPIDYSNLPVPFQKETTIYGSFSLKSRYGVKDKCQWYNVRYRDTFNQLAFTGPLKVCVISDEWLKVLGSVKLEAGDGKYARYTRAYTPVNRPTLRLFEENDPYSLKGVNIDDAPVPYFIDDEYIGFTDRVNFDMTSIIELYYAGYMGKSGDMSDVWPEEMINALHSKVMQGRTISLANATWQAYIPTLDEFKKYMGTAFQTGIPSTVNPVSTVRLPEGKFFLTSTPSSTDPTALVAINADGDIKNVKIANGVSAFLLFKPTLK